MEEDFPSSGEEAGAGFAAWIVEGQDKIRRGRRYEVFFDHLP